MNKGYVISLVFLFLSELGILETSSLISINWKFDKETIDYSNCVNLYNGDVGVNIFTNVKEYSFPSLYVNSYRESDIFFNRKCYTQYRLL